MKRPKKNGTNISRFYKNASTATYTKYCTGFYKIIIILLSY
ncbi:MAG: hypothetical protein OFPI_06500 [Osedax symbiont Rs2]|nr:MAG: hypothetical protein OFPI_06500 [Osedax symbiont Rs2]